MVTIFSKSWEGVAIHCLCSEVGLSQLSRWLLLAHGQHDLEPFGWFSLKMGWLILMYHCCAIVSFPWVLHISIQGCSLMFQEPISYRSYHLSNISSYSQQIPSTLGEIHWRYFRGLAAWRGEFEALSPLTQPNHQVQPEIYWWHTLHTIPGLKCVTYEGRHHHNISNQPTVEYSFSSAHPRSTKETVAFLRWTELWGSPVWQQGASEVWRRLHRCWRRMTTPQIQLRSRRRELSREREHTCNTNERRRPTGTGYWASHTSQMRSHTELGR